MSFSEGQKLTQSCREQQDENGQKRTLGIIENLSEF